VLSEALARYLPGVCYPPLTGGSSCWLEGPAWLDARRLAEEARTERVLIEPGDVHFAEDPPPLNFFRLGFSSIAPGAIREGLRRLGAVLDRQRAQTPSVRRNPPA
jgi:GntR family transcriptional regulator / MocR family aminotransferase